MLLCGVRPAPGTGSCTETWIFLGGLSQLRPAGTASAGLREQWRWRRPCRRVGDSGFAARTAILSHPPSGLPAHWSCLPVLTSSAVGCHYLCSAVGFPWRQLFDASGDGSCHPCCVLWCYSNQGKYFHSFVLSSTASARGVSFPFAVRR